MKYQITFLGSSNLFGRVASSLLRQCPSVGKLKLYDDLDVVYAGVSGSESSCQVQWLKGKEELTTALEGSDIIVIGDECKMVKENEKDSLLAAASKVVDYSFAIAHTVPKAMLVVAASPLNLMVPLIGDVLKELGCYDGRKLLGMTSIDTLRANALYSNYVNQPNAILPVVGGVSPQTRVPVFSQAKPSLSIPEDDQHRMIEEIKSFDLTIHDQDEKTSAIERAYATVRLVHSVISGLLGDPYAAEMALAKTSLIPEVSYFSLPVDLGKSGIERTFGLPQLSPLELEMMNYAVINLNNDLMKAHDLYSTFKPCLDMVNNITNYPESIKQVKGTVKNDAEQLESTLNLHLHQDKKYKSLRRKRTANRKNSNKKRSKLPIMHCPAPDIVADIQTADKFGKIERAHKKLVINQKIPRRKQSEIPELYSHTVPLNENVDNTVNTDKKDVGESIINSSRRDDNNQVNKHDDKKCFKNINCKQSTINEKNYVFSGSKKEKPLKSIFAKPQSENIITHEDNSADCLNKYNVKENNTNEEVKCSQIDGIEANSKNEKDKNRELIDLEEIQLGHSEYNVRDSGIVSNNNVTKGIKGIIDSEREPEEGQSIKIINQTAKCDENRFNKDQTLSADKVSEEVNIVNEMNGEGENDHTINNDISEKQNKEDSCVGNSKNESESSPVIGISEGAAIVTEQNKKTNCEETIKGDDISESIENDKAIIDSVSTFSAVSGQEDKLNETIAGKNINEPQKLIDSTKKEENAINKNNAPADNYNVSAEKSTKEIVPGSVLSDVVKADINRLNKSRNVQFLGEKVFRDRGNEIVEIDSREKLGEIIKPSKETKKQLHNLKNNIYPSNSVNVSLYNSDPKERGNIIREINKQRLRPSFKVAKDSWKQKKKDTGEAVFKSKGIQCAKTIQGFNYQPKLTKGSKTITNKIDILQDLVGGSGPESKNVSKSEPTKQEKNVNTSYRYSSKDKVEQISQASVSNQVVDLIRTGHTNTLNGQTLSAMSSIASQLLNDELTDFKSDRTTIQPTIDSFVEQTKKPTVEPVPILMKNAKTTVSTEDNNFFVDDKNLWLKNKTQSKLKESSPIKVNLDKVSEDKNVLVNSCNILESFTQKGIKTKNGSGYKTDGSKPVTYTLSTKSKKDELSRRYTVLKKGQICNMVKEDINANEIKARLYENARVRSPTKTNSKIKIRTVNNSNDTPAELRFKRDKNINTIDSRKKNMPRSISENDMSVHLKKSNSHALRLKNTSFLNLMVNSSSKGAPTLGDASDAISIRGSHIATSNYDSASINNPEDRTMINQQLTKKAKDQLNITKIKNCKKVIGGLNESFPIVYNDCVDDVCVTKNDDSSENSIAQLKNKLQILKDKYQKKKNNNLKFNSYTVSVDKKEFYDRTKNKKIGVDITYVNNKQKCNDTNSLSNPKDKNKSEQKIGSGLMIKERNLTQENKKDTLLSSFENPIKIMAHNVIEKKNIESDSSILNDKIESSISAILKKNASEEIITAPAKSEATNSTQIGGEIPDSSLTHSVVTDSASNVSQPTNKPIHLEKASVVHDEKCTTLEPSSSEMEKKLPGKEENPTLPKETTEPYKQLKANNNEIKPLRYLNSNTNKKVFNSRPSMSEHSFATSHKKSIHSSLDTSKEPKKIYDSSNINTFKKLSQVKSAVSKFEKIQKQKSIEPTAIKMLATRTFSKSIVKTNPDKKSPDENPGTYEFNKTLLPGVKLEFGEINKLLPKHSSAISRLLDPNSGNRNNISKKVPPNLLHAVKPFKNLNVVSPKLKTNIYERWTPQSLKKNKHGSITYLESDADEEKKRSQKNPFVTGKITMTTSLFKEYMRNNRNNNFTNSTTDAGRSSMQQKFSPLAISSPQNMIEDKLAHSAKSDTIDNSKLNINKIIREDNIFPPNKSRTLPRTVISANVSGTSQISTSNIPTGRYSAPDKDAIKIQTGKTHSSNNSYKPYHSTKTQSNITYQKISNNFNKFSNPLNITSHGKPREEETKRLHLLKAFRDRENTEKKFEELQKGFIKQKQLNAENSMIKYSTTFTKNMNTKKPTKTQQKKMHFLKAYSQESFNNVKSENKPLLFRPLSAPPEYHPSFPLSKSQKQEKENKKNYSEPTLKRRWTQLLDIFQSVIKNEKKNWEKVVPAQHLLFTEGPSHTNANVGSMSDEGSRSNSQKNHLPRGSTLSTKGSP